MLSWPLKYELPNPVKIRGLLDCKDAVTEHINFDFNKFVTVGMLSIKEPREREQWQDTMLDDRGDLVEDLTEYIAAIDELGRRCQTYKKFIYGKYIDMMRMNGKLYNSNDEHEITYYYYNRVWYKGQLYGDEFYVISKSTDLFKLLTELSYVDIKDVKEVLRVKDIKRVYGVT